MLVWPRRVHAMVTWSVSARSRKYAQKMVANPHQRDQSTQMQDFEEKSSDILFLNVCALCIYSLICHIYYDK